MGAAHVSMRTTLKRGVGRGAGANGNGRAVFPPGTVSAVTRYRQPPPPSTTGLGLLRRILVATLLAVVSFVARGRRRLLPLLPPVRRERSRAHARRGSRGEDPRHPGREPRSDRARDRLRPPARRRVEPAVALRHADADPRRPADEDDLAALVPARPRRADLLRLAASDAVGHYVTTDRINSAYSRCGSKGTVLTIKHLTVAPDQLPDHGQLPRLQGGRRQARRRLDGRRPPLLQQEHGLVLQQLREHQPPARLPAADGPAGARLRPLPPHRRRPTTGSRASRSSSGRSRSRSRTASRSPRCRASSTRSRTTSRSARAATRCRASR